MRKVFLFIIAALLDVSMATAQDGGLFLGIQGGPVLNIYENAFSYRENGRVAGLVTPQGGAFLGYDFDGRYGIRLSGSYAKAAGACNVRQTAGGGFYPYSFRSVNAFLDAVVDLTGLAGKDAARFRPKLYGGLGLGRTFAFTDSGHPWQEVTAPNTAAGFRLGVLAEYRFRSGVGLFADLCDEAYGDRYNGLKPSASDQEAFEGYAGFPLDLRGLLSFGVMIHFK